MIAQWKKLAVAGVLAGSLLGLAPSADAVPSPDGQKDVLAAAGSDTTFFLMGGIIPGYFGKYNPDPDAIYNVPPVMASPFPTSYTVPGDGNCAAVTYSAATPPPNGSSAGIAALVADTQGCIDFARSSRGRSATDPATIEFYAYALDAVTWASFPGTHAPANLTTAQLTQIYTCNPATGAPFVTDWSQVGGTAGPIVKYRPQDGSGTLSFFQSKLLGGAVIDANCSTASKSKIVQENKGDQVAAADQAAAIVPYSYGVWNAQKSGIIADERGGAALQMVNGVAPSSKTINETATRFIGTRYVYNVAKTTSPRYVDVIRFTGVDAAGAGYVCSGKASKVIAKYGFTPLKKAPAGSGLPKAACRKEPTPL